MLLFPSPQFRKRRGRTGRAAVAAPPLVLVAAAYESTGPWLVLRFDRAVDAAGLVGAQVTVADGEFASTMWRATDEVAFIDPETFQITLELVGPFAGSDVRLNASAASGIVAVDDGGTWGGVSDLVLPFVP